MKKLNVKGVALFAFLMLSMGFTQFANAQHLCEGKEGISLVEKVDKHTERMASDLNLTEEQTEKVRSLNLKYAQMMKNGRAERQAHKNSGEVVDRSAMKAAFEAKRTEKDAELKAILSPEQYAKHEAIKAKRGEHKHRHWKGLLENEDFRAELKAYKTNHMWPVLKEQRVKLEKEISAEDKATIDELRKDFKEMHAKRNAMKQNRKANKDGKHGKGRHGHGHRKGHHFSGSKKEQVAKAKVLVEKYATSIAALGAEIKEEQAKWEEDINTIKEKYSGQKEDTKRGLHPKHKMRKQIHFLLMDPNGAAEDFVQMNKKTSKNNRTLNKLKVYPVPSKNSNTLAYEVQTAGNVKIELLDKSGQLVKIISNEYRDAGNYEEKIDISKLEKHHYYYQVNMPDGSKEVVRFIKAE